MAQPKNKKSDSQTSRDTTTITINGNQNAVATQGGKANVLHMEGIASADFNAWCKRVEREIGKLKSLPEEDKALLKQNIEQIAHEAEKGQKADSNRIERLLNTVSAMAPDIFDVAITTLGNPLAGIGLAIKKIGDKARVMQKA